MHDEIRICKKINASSTRTVGQEAMKKVGVHFPMYIGRHRFAALYFWMIKCIYTHASIKLGAIDIH